MEGSSFHGWFNEGQHIFLHVLFGRQAVIRQAFGRVFGQLLNLGNNLLVRPLIFRVDAHALSYNFNILNAIVMIKELSNCAFVTN